MLAGTAGVLGGVRAALDPCTISSRHRAGGSRARQRSARNALRRSGVVGAAERGNPGAGARDRRSAPSSVGPRRAPIPARPVARRHRQRSQHHAKRLCRMRLDVPRRRAGGDEAGRRNRIRQRHGGDERERTVRQEPAVRRHCRARRPAPRRRRGARAGGGDRRRRRPLPRHPPFGGLGPQRNVLTRPHELAAGPDGRCDLAGRVCSVGCRST